MLKNKSVNTKGLQIKKGEKTFFWSGKYHDNMNTRDTLDTQLNVLENFEPIVPEKHTNAEYLMLGNLMPSVQKKVLSQMKKRPKLVVLDTMNFWMDNSLDLLLEVIKKVDVITINDEEARQLTGEYSLVKAAAKIHEMGPKYVVIKKGEHGSMLFGDGSFFVSPAFPIKEVIDPTGAGDTFAGGLAGYLSEKNELNFENLKNGIIYGTIMASFCVESFGTSSMENLQKKEVLKRIDAFKTFTSHSV